MLTISTLPKISINKPKTLNSLNVFMIRDISKLIPTIEQYPAFWMEGVGGKAFCAGGDVKALYEGNANAESREQFFREEFTLDYRLAVCKSLYIVNWSGFTMGGGLGISHLAPFRIATENTVLAMPEAKIGFFTDVGVGYTLARIRSNIGMYLALTA
jgi:3-hydroxyisobutyryl-CoA hydrolase